MAISNGFYTLEYYESGVFIACLNSAVEHNFMQQSARLLGNCTGTILQIGIFEKQVRIEG